MRREDTLSVSTRSLRGTIKVHEKTHRNRRKLNEAEPVKMRRKVIEGGSYSSNSILGYDAAKGKKLFPPIVDNNAIFIDKNVETFEKRHLVKHEEKFQPHKWKNQYEHSVRRDIEITAERKEEALNRWYRHFAAKKASVAIQSKIKRNMAILPSVKSTLDNLKHPPNPKGWNEAWGRNYLCERCMEPAATDTIFCQYCNVVAHLQCLDPESLTSQLLMYEDEISLGSLQRARANWSCNGCKEEMNLAREHYTKEKTKLYREMIENKSAKTIQNFMSWAYVRKKYLRTRMYIVMIQTTVRMHQRRKCFLRGQKAKKRPLRIRIIGCKGLVSSINKETVDASIVFTVHEQTKDDQIFRQETSVCLDNNEPVFEEEFFVPCVSGNATLVFTVVDEKGGHCNFLGQYCLLMRTSAIARIGGHRETRLGSLTVPPRSTSKRHKDPDMTAYSKAHGSVKFEVIVIPPTSNYWGMMTGPPVNALISKKPITGHTAKAQHILFGKEVRWWVVLYDGEWMMFKHHHNDPTPKVKLNVRDMEFFVNDDLSFHCRMAKVEQEFMFFVLTKLDYIHWASALGHWTTVTKRPYYETRSERTERLKLGTG